MPRTLLLRPTYGQKKEITTKQQKDDNNNSPRIILCQRKKLREWRWIYIDADTHTHTCSVECAISSAQTKIKKKNKKKRIENMMGEGKDKPWLAFSQFVFATMLWVISSVARPYYRRVHQRKINWFLWFQADATRSASGELWCTVVVTISIDKLDLISQILGDDSKNRLNFTYKLNRIPQILQLNS